GRTARSSKPAWSCSEHYPRRAEQDQAGLLERAVRPRWGELRRALGLVQRVVERHGIRVSSLEQRLPRVRDRSSFSRGEPRLTNGYTNHGTQPSPTTSGPLQQGHTMQKGSRR